MINKLPLVLHRVYFTTCIVILVLVCSVYSLSARDHIGTRMHSLPCITNSLSHSLFLLLALRRSVRVFICQLLSSFICLPLKSEKYSSFLCPNSSYQIEKMNTSSVQIYYLVLIYIVSSQQRVVSQLVTVSMHFNLHISLYVSFIQLPSIERLQILVMVQKIGQTKNLIKHKYSLHPKNVNLCYEISTFMFSNIFLMHIPCFV